MNRPIPADTAKPPDNLPPGDEPNRRIKEPGPSEQPGRPTPSGVPNESRTADDSQRRQGTYEYLGLGIYEYKSVRLRSGWCNESGESSRS